MDPMKLFAIGFFVLLAVLIAFVIDWVRKGKISAVEAKLDTVMKALGVKVEDVAEEVVQGAESLGGKLIQEVERIISPHSVEAVESDLGALEAKIAQALYDHNQSLANAQTNAQEAQAAIAKLTTMQAAVKGLVQVKANTANTGDPAAPAG